MEFRKGTPLREDQRDNPIVWWEPAPEVVLPRVSPQFFTDLFGEGKSQRIKTWGHVDGPLSAHWLATRAGTPMHTDPAYSRYSVQMQIYNEGMFTHGINTDSIDVYPVLSPGVIILLDTHSPHKVSRDPRVEPTGRGIHKMSVAIDSMEMPDRDSAVEALLERIKTPPRRPT